MAVRDALGSLFDGVELSYIRVAIFLTFGILLCQLCLTVYRLLLHPLSKFPGPKLAAATYWYEYYYDVSGKGRYIWRIMDMHQEYGPIVRINPNEVHINDADFYGEIYHSKRYKTHRDNFYNLGYFGQSLAFTTDHDVHAARRQALSSYFSMQSVRALEPRITNVVAHMNQRLHETYVAGTVMHLNWLFSALAIDIISEYTLGTTGFALSMSKPEMGRWWYDLARAQLTMNPFLRQFPFVFTTMSSFPEWFTGWLSPTMGTTIEWRNKVKNQVGEIVKTETSLPNTTMIGELANSSLPEHEKTAARLSDEAILLFAAGGETTSSTLARTSFYILTNPHVLKRLKEELVSAMPVAANIPSIATTAHLPYLNAVIEEGLRISFPLTARAPRVFQDHTLQYKGWTIPPGTAISQSAYTVSSSPTIFPEPFKFDPSRWLSEKETSTPVDQKYHVAFSKGRRSCLGINLAYTELRLAIATVFRRFDLELFETTDDDMRIVADYFIGMPAENSRGLRVKVLRELQ